MIIERTKNTIRNALYGILNKSVIILFPFVVRTIFIYTLGVEYLGLNGLFASILTVLNLTEMGFSQAIVFSMYKPIAEDDTRTIDALLYFYKRVYRIIGLIILLVGLSLIPFLGKLIHGTYPTDINIKLVYLIFLLNTTLSYFLFGYLNSLFSAFQREDIISKIHTITQVLMYACQIIALLSVRKYYYYIVFLPLFTIVSNIITVVLARRKFQKYVPQGAITQEIKRDIGKRVSGLVISKVCQVSRNTFDSIFISMFLGLTSTAIYNNYYYIMNSTVMVTSIFVSSIVAGIGNSVSLDNLNKNYLDFNRMDFVYLWIAGFFTTSLFCLYQPFMRIWVGKDLMYPLSSVILFSLYFYILKMSDIRYAYELANGLWWEYRYRSIAEAVFNLILNYILGRMLGANGIIMATIIPLFFINYLYGAGIIFRCYFKNKPIKNYYFKHAIYFSATVLSCSVTYFLCMFNPIKNSYGSFALNALFCLIVPNLLFWGLYHKTKIFKRSASWFLNRIPAGYRIACYLKV